MKPMRIGLLFVFLLLPLQLHAFTFVTACQPLTSGSYVVNQDVIAAANSPCFTMMGDHITLNLGGHTIYGSAGAPAITDGGVARRGISISTGNMRVDIGINLAMTTEARIESLNIDSAAGPAISVGAYSKVMANAIAHNGTIGISVQCPSLLVWNNIAFGSMNIVEVGKGCKTVNNTSTKK